MFWPLPQQPPSGLVDAEEWSPGEHWEKYLLPTDTHRWFAFLLLTFWDDRRPARDMGAFVSAAWALAEFWRVTKGRHPTEEQLREPRLDLWVELYDSVRAPAEEALRKIDGGWDGTGLTIDELLSIAPVEVPGGIEFEWSWREGDG